MNGNELIQQAHQFADDLQQGEDLDKEEQMAGATIVWRLIDRIAELEKQIELSGKVNRSLIEGITNAEPVAWMNKDTGVVCKEVYGKTYDLIPLYTTPQTNPLDNDEIEELQKEYTEKGRFSDTLDIHRFARAIEERILGK